MNPAPPQLWLQVFRSEEAGQWLRQAMRHAAGNLSEMVRRPISVDALWAEVVPLSSLTLTKTDPEIATLGVYLAIIDELPGQAILMLSPDEARRLADWLLEAPEGSTTQLGQLECSALAETGNLILASFLNTLGALTQNPLRLLSPLVTVDMLATILQQVAVSVAETSDELLIIKTDFKEGQSAIQLHFWILPDPSILKTMNRSQMTLILETLKV